jgi:hypothetical protein
MAWSTSCSSGAGSGPEGRYLLEWDGTYRDVVFSLSTVHAQVPGDGYWVVRQWNGARHIGWLINLAAPWTRTPIGFDTLDHKLDIEVADDLSGWRWKDEDGLAWMIERGLYSPEKGEEIRAAGPPRLRGWRRGSHPSTMTGQPWYLIRTGRCQSWQRPGTQLPHTEDVAFRRK